MSQNTKRYFLSVPPLVTCLGTGSAIAILIKTLLLDRIPEPFVGMSKLGAIVDGLLASILASVVFYFVVIHIKEIRDRDHVNPVLANWIGAILASASEFLSASEKASCVQLNLSTLSREDVERAFKAINPHSDAPIVSRLNPEKHGNWFHYMRDLALHTERMIELLQTQSLYLDARLASLLSRLGWASFIGMAKLNGIKLANQDLSAWASSFYSYVEILRELDEVRSSLGDSKAQGA